MISSVHWDGCSIDDVAAKRAKVPCMFTVERVDFQLCAPELAAEDLNGRGASSTAIG